LYLYVRFHNEDGSCCHSLASSPSLTSASSQYLAVGTESGVVSLYDEVLDAENASRIQKSSNPQTIKSIMNITTSITSLQFHPSSQILAMASDQVRASHPIFKLYDRNK